MPNDKTNQGKAKTKRRSQNPSRTAHGFAITNVTRQTGAKIAAMDARTGGAGEDFPA